MYKSFFESCISIDPASQIAITPAFTITPAFAEALTSMLSGKTAMQHVLWYDIIIGDEVSTSSIDGPVLSPSAQGDTSSTYTCDNFITILSMCNHLQVILSHSCQNEVAMI